MTKTIEEQTGWKRPAPLAICQEVEILLKVFEYSFDIYDKKFRKYITQRTGRTFNDGNIDYYINWTEKEVMERQDFTYIKSDDPRYSGKPLEKECRIFHWKLIRMTRGSIQDCWELWQLKNNPDNRNIKKEKQWEQSKFF
ncbi:hypothetical protein KAR91_31395 [Candidatus Pacearchaeota archaeon]|nr:hypothetical protein [Candidatus Pacearchaeota archaeon]